jgi:FkbM family methyltransferase
VARLSDLALAQLARRGFVVRRHLAARRQSMLTRHGVDLVLDVGAARGLYAEELRRFGYRGRIASFEPLRAAYADLARACASDPAWSAHHYALGDEAGTATIHVASNSDSSSILPMARAHVAAAPHVGYVADEEIEVRRLDDVAAEVVGDAAHPFLKIDTQGFEDRVLRGGEKTLPRCVGLQLELSFVPVYDGGMLVDEAISWAYDHGFRLVGIDPGFADPRGHVLQADGLFFRDLPDEDGSAG